MPSPASILKETFGYDSFRPLQQEIIENVLAHKDTLAIMPTGGGKSLCYQIPSLLFTGLTVVVSPLISLMKDQVEQLRAYGVPSLFINSTLSAQEYQQNMDYVKRGEVKLLYVAPETLLTPRILALLDSIQVDCLTIDEAHCISEWGHDFRPEYRKLVEVRKRFPKAVCLALTATATSRVRQDIRTTLKFSTSNEFVASFNRENLYIEVVRKREPTAQAINIINRYKNQSGIIYCFSRKQVDELSAYLASKNYSVKPYHAGLEDNDRKKNQELFIRDDVQIIVATIAFGMGINKPNVRFVIHFDLPKSVESYYQEIGRAGRDGLPAHCTLLYSYGDVAKINYFIDQKEGDEKRVAIEHLNAIVRFAEDEMICRRKPLLSYFGESNLADNCSNCDNCTSAPTSLTDITVYAQKFLSCVKRADEKFGAGHITDILLGSKNEKIIRWGHDKLSTYNIGTELTKKQWMHIARQLMSTGYLKQEGEYHTLSLTPKAIEMLKKRESVFGVVQEADRVKIKGQRTDIEYNHELFEILKVKRKEIADRERVPPYVIFSDKALVEMAAYYPQNENDMLKITGVGKVKLKQYGELYMGMIKTFCEKNALTPNPSPRIERGEREVGGKTIMIADGFNDGLSIQALMDRHKVTQGTILEHLTKYVTAGSKLHNADELQSLTSATKVQIQIAFSAFDESDNLFLKPVFETLNGALNYDQLKILKLLYLINKQGITAK